MTLSGTDQQRLRGYVTGPPSGRTVAEPRCTECGKMLARLATRPWVIDCSRCGATNGIPQPDNAGG